MVVDRSSHPVNPQHEGTTTEQSYMAGEELPSAKRPPSSPKKGAAPSSTTPKKSRTKTPTVPVVAKKAKPLTTKATPSKTTVKTVSPLHNNPIPTPRAVPPYLQAIAGMDTNMFEAATRHQSADRLLPNQPASRPSSPISKAVRKEPITAAPLSGEPTKKRVAPRITETVLEERLQQLLELRKQRASTPAKAKPPPGVVPPQPKSHLPVGSGSLPTTPSKRVSFPPQNHDSDGDEYDSPARRRILQSLLQPSLGVSMPPTDDDAWATVSLPRPRDPLQRNADDGDGVKSDLRDLLETAVEARLSQYRAELTNIQDYYLRKASQALQEIGNDVVLSADAVLEEAVKRCLGELNASREEALETLEEQAEGDAKLLREGLHNLLNEATSTIQDSVDQIVESAKQGMAASTADAIKTALNAQRTAEASAQSVGDMEDEVASTRHELAHIAGRLEALERSRLPLSPPSSPTPKMKSAIGGGHGPSSETHNLVKGLIKILRMEEDVVEAVGAVDSSNRHRRSTSLLRESEEGRDPPLLETPDEDLDDYLYSLPWMEFLRNEMKRAARKKAHHKDPFNLEVRASGQQGSKQRPQAANSPSRANPPAKAVRGEAPSPRGNPSSPTAAPRTKGASSPSSGAIVAPAAAGESPFSHRVAMQRNLNLRSPADKLKSYQEKFRHTSPHHQQPDNDEPEFYLYSSSMLGGVDEVGNSEPIGVTSRGRMESPLPPSRDASYNPSSSSRNLHVSSERGVNGGDNDGGSPRIIVFDSARARDEYQRDQRRVSKHTGQQRTSSRLRAANSRPSSISTRRESSARELSGGTVELSSQHSPPTTRIRFGVSTSPPPTRHRPTMRTPLRSTTATPKASPNSEVALPKGETNLQTPKAKRTISSGIVTAKPKSIPTPITRKPAIPQFTKLPKAEKHPGAAQTIAAPAPAESAKSPSSTSLHVADTSPITLKPTVGQRAEVTLDSPLANPIPGSEPDQEFPPLRDYSSDRLGSNSPSAGEDSPAPVAFEASVVLKEHAASLPTEEALHNHSGSSSNPNDALDMSDVGEGLPSNGSLSHEEETSITQPPPASTKAKPTSYYATEF